MSFFNENCVKKEQKMKKLFIKNSKLYGISGLVMNPHRCFGDSCPCTVFITKLCGHVRFLAEGFGFLNVLIPQQCQRDSTFCKLGMDVGIVRLQIHTDGGVPFRKEDGFDLFIGHGFLQWPGEVMHFRSD